jgi:hypothetical protein
LVNPCFIHVHDIIPCFPKRFDLYQIITPIIYNRHLVVQNSSIITYFLILDIRIQKIGDNRRVLYDQVSIINDRCNYLIKIKSFREAGYDIVYMDETWVNQNHCTKNSSIITYFLYTYIQDQ